MKTKPCPFCAKGELKRKEKKIHFKYKGQSISVVQPGSYCAKCKEGIVEGVDVKATEKEIHDFRSKVDGYLSSDEVRRIRKKLRLTQHQAARLFGGGLNAFSRYERGEIRQTKALDQLLRLLDRYPKHLVELEGAEAA